jgi:hypothetical protein
MSRKTYTESEKPKEKLLNFDEFTELQNAAIEERRKYEKSLRKKNNKGQFFYIFILIFSIIGISIIVGSVVGFYIKAIDNKGTYSMKDCVKYYETEHSDNDYGRNGENVESDPVCEEYGIVTSTEEERARQADANGKIAGIITGMVLIVVIASTKYGDIRTLRGNSIDEIRKY